MKSRALAFGCLLLGGILGLISSAQPWWRASGEGVVVKFTGTQVTGGLSQALAIVALAGTLLMLVLQARGRRVVGAVLLLVGLGLVLSGALRLQPSADAVRSQVREVSLVDAFQLSVTAWPWIFALSGVAIVTGAVLTMITAAHWPARSERFRASQVTGAAGGLLTTQQSCGRRWMQAPIRPLMRASEIAHRRTEKEEAEALFLRERRRRRWIHRAMREQLKE